MIDRSPGNLLDEIRAGQKYVEQKMAPTKKVCEHFHGHAWGGSELTDLGGQPIENHPYEYTSLIIPQIVYANPRFTTHSMRTTDVHQMVSEALQQGLNRWCNDVALVDLLRLLCFDYLTGWGVALLTFEPNDRIRLPHLVAAHKGFVHPMWPVVTRLSPDDFFFDPAALTFQECRWYAHRTLWDLEDLRELAEKNEDGTWLYGEVLALQSDGARQGAEDVPEREQKWVYELWLREDVEGNEKNEHGRIYTLVEDTSTEDENDVGFIREPRDYYGPPTGPYYPFGAFPLRDEPGWLSPIVATLHAQKEADDFARAFSNSAKNYKQEFITQSAKLARIMASSPHQHVHHMEGPLFDAGGHPSFATVEIGGATREQMEGVLQARDRLERMTGMSDAMRGQTGGATTATEEQIAFQGGSIRIDDLRERFTRRLVDLAKAVLWYMFTDEQFVIPVGGEKLGSKDAWFEGGDESGLVELAGMTFYDMELVVEPYSMERINDSARMARLGALAGQAIQIGQAMPMMPWLNWHEIVNDLGMAYNVPDFGSRFNWEALNAMWQQGGMPMAPAQGQGKLASHTPPGTQGARLAAPSGMRNEKPSGRSAGQQARHTAPKQ